MPSFEQIASCVSGYDPDALQVTSAREFIAQAVPRPTAIESSALTQALGRVLARDLVSTIDVPAEDNAAMDGYALRGAEIKPGADTVLRVAGTGLAGNRFVGDVPGGHCVRIMTGAVVPAGLDTVVPQEFTRAGPHGNVVLPAGCVRAGDNRRRAGEDLARGATALTAGRVLRPVDIGLAASIGMAELPVYRRLRVAFFSTGDELRSVGEPLPLGCVYDSNRYVIAGMLQRLGVDAIDLGVVRDDPAALETAFADAAARADAVVTSGGVSVGDADHTRQVMRRVGEVLFWKIAMRPGRPMAIGRLTRASGAPDDRPVMLFGLPGNPVAVMVTFYVLVRDALLAMAGAAPAAWPLMRATAIQPLRKKPGRSEFQRGVVSRAADGSCQVRTTGAQGSGILHSMSEANALVVLHHDQGDVAAGDPVDVLLLDAIV